MTSQNKNERQVTVVDSNCDAFAERIELLINSVGGNSEFARKCGASESVVRSWKKGDSDPSRKRLIAISEAFDVSLAWLATGEGEMHPANTKMSLSSSNQEGLPLKLDRQKIVLAIETVEEGLQITGRVMKPNKKAELIMAVYDLLAEQSEQQPQIKKETLLRLVKSAT